MIDKVFGLLLISVWLGVVGQLALKQGLIKIGRLEIADFFSKRLFELIKEKFVLIGFVSYGLATLLWLVVLSQAEVSYAYPLLAIGYMLVAILAKLFFGEDLTLVRMAGISLICVGVYLITLKI